MRVYDQSGLKIGKGIFVSGNASGLKVYHAKKEHFFEVQTIGELRTRRSAGHNVLVGAGIGALAWGAVEANNYDGGFWSSRGNAFMAATIAGSVPGGVAGGVSNVKKKGLPVSGKWRIGSTGGIS